MKKNIFIISTLLLVGILASYFYYSRNRQTQKSNTDAFAIPQYDKETEELTHPLQIKQMRNKKYPGSEIIIEKKLINGNGFDRYVASYLSEGLKINGVLTIPIGNLPEGGWPAIVFNHGYIRPETYKREEKYIAYISGFASKGYVVYMPDYRGHQDSEGLPLGAYFSPAYTTDSLNAFYSLSKHPSVNPEKVGMWGHSMGGHITLRSMVISPDIKVGVIWAGVVASYEDMLKNWRRDRPWRPSPRENLSNRPGRDDLTKIYGEIEENKDFWQSISPIYFASDISGPVQLHHGSRDTSVPWEFSKNLQEALLSVGKTVDYYNYEGADHNLSDSAFNPAMKRSVEFFNIHLRDL
jgi:dipeptidyl aminopeptidase/acylaminoacyl peptidase